MANPFDQFDQTAAPTPVAAPSAVSKGNPFDTFDHPASTPSLNPVAPSTNPFDSITPTDTPSLGVRTMNALNKGAGDFLDLPGKLIDSAINPVLSAVGLNPGQNNASQDLGRLGLTSDSPGMNPQSKGEEYLQSAARALGGNAIPAILTGGLASIPGVAAEVGGSVGQGLGEQGAKDLSGGNPAAQAVGSILGALAGGLTAGGIAHALTPEARATVQQLFDSGAPAAAVQKAAQDAGSALNPDELAKAVQYRDAGGKGAQIAPPAPTELANLPTGTAGEPSYLDDLNEELAKIDKKMLSAPEGSGLRQVMAEHRQSLVDEITAEKANQSVSAPTVVSPANPPSSALSPHIQELVDHIQRVEDAEMAGGKAIPVQGNLPGEIDQPDMLPKGPYENTKMAANVNSERLGTNDETRQYLGEATYDLQISPQTHGDLIGKADDLIKNNDPLDILSADPKASEIDTYHLANRAILKGALDKMQQAAARVLDPETDSTAAVDALDKYRYLTSVASARVSNDATLAGRLLNARKIMAGDASANIAEGLGRLDASDARAFAQEVVDRQNNPEQVARNSFVPGWRDRLSNALNLPRSIMSSVDLSAPFNQGLGMVHKPQFWAALPSMIKQFGSESAHQAAQDSIRRDANFPLMQKSGLYLAGKTLNTREEAFMSSYAEKIPVLGHLIKGSERAYTGFLNKVRADVFNDLVEKGQAAGINYSDSRNKKALTDLSTFINTSTGRGDLPLGLNKAAPLLNSVFFSPRLIASRVQMLNPAYYVKLDPFARKEALKSLLAVGSFGATALGLAAAGGMKVGVDPRSTDFAKIENGNTRYSPLGSFQPYLRLGSQLVTNQRTTSSGQVQELGGKYGVPTRLDQTMSFIMSKESPVLSAVTDFLRGKDAGGNPFTVSSAVANRFVPMFVQDMADIYQDSGVKKMLLSAPGAALGIGTQTYPLTDPTAKRLGVTQPDDAVVTELHRVEDPDHPLITPVGSKVQIGDDTVTLTKEQKDAYQKDAGRQIYQNLSTLMKDPSWEVMSKEDQREAVKQVMTDAKSDARDRMQ